MNSHRHQATSSSPWRFIPTLYFAQGVPNTIINTVSVILYKRLGISNQEITLWTSFLNLPWVLKMFWAPFVDTNSTKRTWMLAMQLAMFACLGMIALSLQLPNFFVISLTIFAIAAFISATYDIAIYIRNRWWWNQNSMYPDGYSRKSVGTW